MTEENLSSLRTLKTNIEEALEIVYEKMDEILSPCFDGCWPTDAMNTYIQELKEHRNFCLSSLEIIKDIEKSNESSS